ncbi:MULTISPECIES: hypothetical protein [Bacillus]|uniref:hypothetical protein n=1 Tax=Bacillus TaxID=1386 RepID=UPI0002E6759A|nr:MULTISPECIES: hypothetical protein [Bacillus]AJK64940.1 hypothetical protein KHU1_0973 [Bacillus amyloliquefaciens KHG19]MDU0102998.1 hypothetical protein [Bacillus sp. IS1]MDV2630121.1 hypothetical protein [Bacillus velezensis]MDX7896354.1 hypothetical protein [Bacillus velezensis]MDX8026880.1 hypothetical protein [Bacillus velezensis]
MGRRNIRVRDTNRIPELLRNLEPKGKMKVGVLDGDRQMIAAVHEFGCRIAVTDRMRNYLAAKGLYLKKDTQFINIPERSFLRAGWDENEAEIVQKVEELVNRAIENGDSINDIMNAVGLLAKGRLQTYARDLRSPANHPFTTEEKGSSNPLVDTGEMIGSMDYEVES